MNGAGRSGAGNPYSDWVGRSELVDDVLVPSVLARLWATIDHDEAPPRTGDPLPVPAHWLYFLSAPRKSDLGADGHERLGGFIPPVPLPRRMWAGSKIDLHHPLRVGDIATRRSVVNAVVEKQGRTGPLVFVTLCHEFMDGEGLAMTEMQDLVYRGPLAPGAMPTPPVPEHEPDFSAEVMPDPVMLFRYSALTFNGHKIHYDRDYATGEEGYPGLVVHGPLVATLLLDLLRTSSPDLTPGRVDVRAISPLFDGASFSIHGCVTEGTRAQLWACDPDGRIAMRVSVEAAQGQV